MLSRFLSRARKIIKKPSRVIELIANAQKKLQDPGQFSKTAKDELWLFLRLLKAWARREYTDIQTSSIVKVIAAVLYFVFVIDLIPDFIVGVGLLDDASVILWTFRGLKEELDKFREWEIRQKNPSSMADDKL